MDFFASFKERAQQAVNAATELATTVGAESQEYFKVIADTVTSDVKVVAEDARAKARNLTEETEEPARPRLRDLGVTDRVLSVVRSLTYASFADRDNIAASDAALQQWQVKHATAILQECPELDSLRFTLCPKRMTESQFWAIYFQLVDAQLEQDYSTRANSVSGEDYACAASAVSNDAQLRSPALSGLGAWEAVQHDDVNSMTSPPDQTAVPSGIEDVDAAGGDDLDAYLKDVLDGDGDDGEEHAGVSEAGDDIDAYLKELGGDGEGPGGDKGAAGELEDLDTYLGELNLTDDDAEPGDLTSP